MRYTVHVGPRSDEWPVQVGEAPSRAAACQLAQAALGGAPPDSKAEVRESTRLLDMFGQPLKGHSRVRHLYAAPPPRAAQRALL